MGNTDDKSKTQIKEKDDKQKIDLQDFVSSSNGLVRSKENLVKTLDNSLIDLSGNESNNPISKTIKDLTNVSFSVDAGIIDRLGRELVSKKETAVSELIKNAYDADAENVRLIFIDADTESGELTIEDDGSGMTLFELVNGFMRISSFDKAENPNSPVYKRQRAGRKGIGRFQRSG